MNIRKTAVAGLFYENDSALLEKELKYIKENKNNQDAFAIIAPHAGYLYSGEVAGEVYKQIREDYNKVIVLAPNHTTYTKKAILDENDAWETPLGQIKLIKLKTQNTAFEENKIIHKQEHAIETHIPFLQIKLKNFELLPIIIGDINEVDLNKIASEIKKILTDKTLLVISTDLSHYLTEKHAREEDEETIQKILKLQDVHPENACGANPLRVLNRILKDTNKKPELIKYDTSAKASRNTREVVGYVSFIIKN
ncbi:MAG: AmmeMemoRadiSam system protein B [Candidatus Woesearchaeota archaeon]